MFGKVLKNLTAFVVIDSNNVVTTSSSCYERAKNKLKPGDTLYLSETNLTEIDEDTIRAIEEVSEGDYIQLFNDII